MTVEITFTVPSTGETESLAIDATVDQQHRSSAMVTEHPVEDGSTVTDHVRADQDTLVMNVFVTNAPIKENVSNNVTGVFREIDLSSILMTPPKRESGPRLANSNTRRPRWEGGNLLGPLQKTDGPAAMVLQYDEFDRVEYVYGVLRALLTTGTIVRLVTSLRTYENMLFEELITPRDAKTGDAAQFQVTARQIRIVETQTVDSPPDPSETRGRRRSNRGNQQTDEAEGGESAATRASLWMRASQAAGLL